MMRFCQTIILLFAYTCLCNVSVISGQFEEAIIFPIPSAIQRSRSVDFLDTVSRQFKAIDELSRSSEAFSLELFQQLGRDEAISKQRNFIISPFSIWSILLLLAEGATANTYKQFAHTLRLPDDLTQIRAVYKYLERELMIQNSDVELSTNQVLFSDVNRPIDIDFQFKLEHIYEADNYPINFLDTVGAHEKINNYVREKTNGKILQVIDVNELNQAQMILISAIFFRGRWKYAFNVDETTLQSFYDENNSKIAQVSMMYRKGGCSHVRIPELKADALELAYGSDGKLSMIILLPNKQVPLTTVSENLYSLGLNVIMNRLKHTTEDPDLEVYLPRFSLASDYNMNNVLKKMGLNDVFDANVANFSRISEHKVYVSKVVHKAIVEVDEFGSIAAAVTGTVVEFLSASTQFYVNRPFAFFIIERTTPHTTSLLFCGQVRNPAES